MVHQPRVQADASTLSYSSSVPEWAIVCFDTLFLLLTTNTIIIKVATQGPAGFFASGWARLDAGVLFFSLSKMLFPNWKRSLLSLSALRVFMLLPRIPASASVARMVKVTAVPPAQTNEPPGGGGRRGGGGVGGAGGLCV